MSLSQLLAKTDELDLAKSLLESLQSLQSEHMDDDDLSVIDTPGETTDAAFYEKQLASLQTYINSLPYKCESVEDIQDRLEDIIEKLYICAKTKNWTVLTTWDGMLQW
jgi:proteasome activator subunit 4